MNTCVDFETAKFLNSWGFDKKVRGRYCVKEILPFKLSELYISDYKIDENFIYAPTIADVVTWLYKKHGIWIYSKFDYSINKWYYIIQDTNNILEIDTRNDFVFNLPTEAYQEAIKYVLNNLIK